MAAAPALTWSLPAALSPFGRSASTTGSRLHASLDSGHSVAGRDANEMTANRAPGWDPISVWMSSRIPDIRVAPPKSSIAESAERSTTKYTFAPPCTVTGVTGGQFFRFDRTDSLGIDRYLDAIRAAPAPGQEPGRGDSPVVVLVAALALAGLLGVSLVAVRR